MIRSLFERRWVRLFSWWLGSRLLIAASMVAGTWAARPIERYPYWAGTDGGLLWQQVPIRLLDVWGRWDSLYYLSLAEGGYPASYPEGGWVFHGAFFPLFPVLVRGASVLLGGASLFYVGVVLANLCLALSAVYLDKLLRLDHAPRIAEWAVAALLCYPGSHFLSVVYPESTALFLAVLAFYLVRTGRPGTAFIAAALATVCRPTGFFVAGAVALELWLGRREKRISFIAWVTAFLPVLAGLSWLGLHQQVYGDPFYFLHVQAAWNRKATLPLTPLFDFSLSPDHQVFWLAAAGAWWLGLKQRARTTFTAYSGALLIFPLFFGSLRSIHRFLAGNFPLLPVVVRAFEERPRTRAAALALSLVLLAVFSYRWGAGAWPN